MISAPERAVCRNGILMAGLMLWAVQAAYLALMTSRWLQLVVTLTGQSPSIKRFALSRDGVRERQLE